MVAAAFAMPAIVVAVVFGVMPRARMMRISAVVSTMVIMVAAIAAMVRPVLAMAAPITVIVIIEGFDDRIHHGGAYQGVDEVMPVMVGAGGERCHQHQGDACGGDEFGYASAV